MLRRSVRTNDISKEKSTPFAFAPTTTSTLAYGYKYNENYTDIDIFKSLQNKLTTAAAATGAPRLLSSALGVPTKLRYWNCC